MAQQSNVAYPAANALVVLACVTLGIGVILLIVGINGTATTTTFNAGEVTTVDWYPLAFGGGLISTSFVFWVGCMVVWAVRLDTRALVGAAAAEPQASIATPDGALLSAGQSASTATPYGASLSARPTDLTTRDVSGVRFRSLERSGVRAYLMADLADALGITSDRLVKGLTKERRRMLMLEFRDGGRLQSAYFIARDDVLPAVQRVIFDPMKVTQIGQTIDTA